MYINDAQGFAIIQETPEVPKHTLIVAESGAGKSVTMEAIANFYYENGYTIISLTDTKDKIELAYSMFEPKEKYHINFNKSYEIPIKAIPTKIYHPLTFQIPRTKLPQITFFGIPLRYITRQQLNYITESDQETEAIRILNQAIPRLKPNEGLHHLIYQIEEKTEKKPGNLRNTDPDSFFTKASEGGTQKTITQIITYFKPFLTDYFLLPNNHENNINIKQLINDQQNYHVFTTKYIKDEKIKSFIINILIEQILTQAEEHAKHPILIILEELKFLTPEKTQGYTTYLSQTMRNFFSISRNKGKGIASISTSQEYFKLSTDIRNSINQLLIGKITGLQELEKIGKALSLRQAEKDKIKALTRGEYVTNSLKGYDPYTEPFKTHLPFHRHAEVGYNFEQTYQEEHPNQITNYKELLQKLQQTKNQIETDVKKIVENKNKQKTEEHQKKQKQKQETKKQILQEQTQKIILTKQKNQEQQEQLAKTLTQEYEEENTSYQKLADKYGIYKQKVIRLIKKQQKKQITNSISEADLSNTNTPI